MITRNNYEEFFLLYVDNELSAAERQAVERFVAANPDLREEWELLMQCRVSPDEAPVFAGKQLLMRTEDTSLINLDNYDVWFLSYIDGELDGPARQAVLDFVNQHPDKNIELQRLQQTVSVPDRTIVFPDKTILYRREQPRKIAWVPFARIAAAALVLGAVGLAVFHPFRNTSSGTDPLASGKTASASGKTIAPALVNVAPATGTDTASSALADATPSRQEPADVPANVTTAPAQQPAAKKTLATVTPRTVDTLHLYKSNRPEDEANTTAEPVVAKVDLHVPDKTIASIKMPPAANNPIGNTDLPGKVVAPDPKTSFATQALLSHTVAYTDDGSMEETVSPKKNKLRGIFRKVTRALEKPASREDDEDKKVLIGGFQIALQ